MHCTHATHLEDTNIYQIVIESWETPKNNTNLKLWLIHDEYSPYHWPQFAEHGPNIHNNDD